MCSRRETRSRRDKPPEARARVEEGFLGVRTGHIGGGGGSEAEHLLNLLRGVLLGAAKDGAVGARVMAELLGLSDGAKGDQADKSTSLRAVMSLTFW